MQFFLGLVCLTGFFLIGPKGKQSSICFIVMGRDVHARLVLVPNVPLFFILFIFSIITLLLRIPLILILLVGIYFFKFVYKDS
jgi:hypothetical protein